MKKMMALIALAAMVFVGCAHRDKDVGGSSDDSTSTSGSYKESNPSRTSDTSTNSTDISNTSTNSSTPQQQ
jgi:hypothetical protein